MKWLLILLFAGSLVAQDAQRFFYSKSFPGSDPAYVQVTLEKNGEAVYREAPDDDQPLMFKLTGAETAEVYALVEKLDYFKHPVESGLKVAFMGTKTFRLEKGAQKTEVQFNYSEDANAKLLWDWCERLTESAQHRIELARGIPRNNKVVPLGRGVQVLPVQQFPVHRQHVPGLPVLVQKLREPANLANAAEINIRGWRHRVSSF